ncbi:MAG: MarR family transcriptional regulator [Bryobacter sp.]
MSGKIAKEIQQAKPFTQREEEAYLNLARSYEYLTQQLTELFRRWNLSTTQYNVLRILRGVGEAGLSCTEAARRMITHDPDITRLFDRLEGRGLIQRGRLPEDRRVVMAYITESGLELLAELDQPVAELHSKQFAMLEREEVAELIQLLEELRPSPE